MNSSPPQAELDDLDALFDSGRFADVIDRGEKLLVRFPDCFFVCQLLGTTNGMLGRDEQAVEHFRKALEIKPEFAIGYVNLGVGLERLDRKEEAVAAYESALELEPDSAEAYYCLASTLQALERLEGADAAYEKALQIRPDHAEAYYNRGIVLEALDRSDEAIVHFRQALRIQPNFSEALHNLGISLRGLGQVDEAIACARRAVEIKPDFAEAYISLGAWLRHVGRIDEAIACCRRALAIKPDLTQGYLDLALLLQNRGRIDEAIACYGEALRLKPDHADARAQKLNLHAMTCDWDALQPEAHLIPMLGVSGDPVAPFTMLTFDDDPERNRRRSENLAANEYRRSSQPEPERPTARSDRIRLGYFSADFHEHAVMHCMARLIELHDRSRFSVHLFSYGPDSRDWMRQRLENAADAFHDVRQMGDKAIAAFARRERIDIAVDLMGYTYANRLGIFASRAAPIQISYLGFPGTLGAPFIDYIVADKIVIPDETRQHFSEHILYLPHSYQVNDDLRPVADPVMTRTEMGLREDGFVFCCFTNTYKISAELFDIWMRLLAQVERSVLWLFRANPWAEGNLRHEAQKRGIDPDRLVFADQISFPEHMARHAHADLFLDTFNYNGHATASHALWAGLPLVTRTGQGFAARVASSLLNAIGLPELIAKTSQDYERLALALARDPDRLSRIRAKLASNRLTAPLFDAKLSAHHIEAAYERAYELFLEGKPAADIVIEEGPAPSD